MKLVAWVGRSQQAAGRILQDIGLPWGHQVAVLFQIVCAPALDVPLVLLDLESMHSMSPNVNRNYKPWGHLDHNGEGVRASLRTAQERMFMTCRWLPMSRIPPP